MFFFAVQNNQLYKIVRYLYSFRAIFVLFLVKLGNKSEVMESPWKHGFSIKRDVMNVTQSINFDSRKAVLEIS